MTSPATSQSAESWAFDARRRSFAWGVVAGKRRVQLGRELGLSPAEVQSYLASPGMALLTWVWRGFRLHQRRGGLADVVHMTVFFLREALEDRHGCRLRVGELLGLILGLVGCAFLGVTRDLCAEVDRHMAFGRKGPSPLSPRRLRLVHAMAELIERVVEARLRVIRAEDLANYEQDFQELALEGGDPYLELLDTDLVAALLPPDMPAPPADPLSSNRPARVVALEDGVRFKRRRKPWPPLVRLRPIERAA